MRVSMFLLDTRFTLEEKENFVESVDMDEERAELAKRAEKERMASGRDTSCQSRQNGYLLGQKSVKKHPKKFTLQRFCFYLGRINASTIYE